MNEKIANQIAEMKKQTIGVEVEMKEAEPQSSPPTSSEQADAKTQPQGTATALGQLGMRTAESGNSKRMSALQDATARNAKW